MSKDLYCKDCWNCVPPPPGQGYEALCLKAVIRTDKVSGITYYQTCKSERSCPSRCGPEAKNFEPDLTTRIFRIFKRN